MHQVTQMLNTHAEKPVRAADALSACIQECFDCAESCTMCADACLSEERVKELRGCIRANLDCADICNATGRLLSRQTEADWRVVRSQLQALIEAVRVCAEVCELHAKKHEHCRICAEECRRCEQSCLNLLSSAQAEVTH